MFSHWSAKYRSRSPGQGTCRVSTSRGSTMQDLVAVYSREDQERQRKLCQSQWSTKYRSRSLGQCTCQVWTGGQGDVSCKVWWLIFFFFFFFWFGFYGPFENISLISSRSFIEGGRKPENPEKNHLTIRKQNLAFPHMSMMVDRIVVN